MSLKVWNEERQEWIVVASNKATAISLLDIEDNYEDNSVEGALKELGRTKNQVNLNTQSINNIKTKFDDHLKNHPAGNGGGTILPTIESSFEIQTSNADNDIIIPIYFTSPNLGEGICYVSVNNIEIRTQTVEQGDNNIRVPALGSGVFTIELKVKDRSGLLSNKLSWKVTCGGIKLNLLSNYSVFTQVGKEVSFDYEIITNVNSQVYLHLTLDDNEELLIKTSNGKHSYNLGALTLGIHKVSYYAEVGDYKTKTYSNNIVITNSESLYLSSNTDSTVDIVYGNPVIIDYCVSKVSEENFKITFETTNSENEVTTINGTCKSGTYTWSNNSLDIGIYSLKITVVDKDKNSASLNFTINILEDTEYEKIECSKYQLVAWWDASYNKSNINEDKNIWVDRISGITGTLHNFNYVSNGWMSDINTNEYWLECNGRAYVEIPYAPFSDNFENGCTIDICFKVNNIGNPESRILDITEKIDSTDKYIGCYINTQEACFNSREHTSSTPIGEDEYIHVTFVIDRVNKLGLTYINGVPTNVFILTDSIISLESFRNDAYIYLNSTKGEGYGSCCIKHLRIYNTTLSHKDIVTIMISDIENKAKQREEYLFNFDNKTLPKMYLTFNREGLTADKNNPLPLTITYESPNSDLYGNGFTSSRSYIYAQGTSSLEYVVPNFNILLMNESGEEMYYNPFKDTAKEETLFCLKANYMESSNVNNVGLADFANDCLFDKSTYNPAQIKEMNNNGIDKPRVRHTIAGFPIVVYVKDLSKGSNAEFESYGIYDFNTDRYSPNTFGYSQYTNGECLCYEAAANTRTGVAAFYEYTGADAITQYRNEFKLIYPPTREGTDNYSEMINLVKFVSNAGIENFSTDIYSHFNVPHLIRYYLFVLMFGLVDSLGKNMKLTSFDGGNIWYPQLYDMDTALGLNNTGSLLFDVDIEPQHGSSGLAIEEDKLSFNTSNSNLWTKLSEYMWDDIVNVWKELRTPDRITGVAKFSLENIMYYLYDRNMAKIPAYYYAESMQQKYLNFKDSHIGVMHGSRYHHMKKWIKERLLYMDTLLDYTASTEDYIGVRAEAHMGQEIAIDIEPYSPMYIRVKWTNAGGSDLSSEAYSKVKVGRGEIAHLVTTLDSNDQEVMIYGGKHIKRLHNLSTLRPKRLNLSAAKRLINLDCHSDVLTELHLNGCSLLQDVDISNCSILGSTDSIYQILDLTGCPNLKYVNAYNTKIHGITTDDGGNLEEIYYPFTTQSIVLSNQNALKVLGIPTNIIYNLEIKHSLNKFCDSLNSIYIKDCPNIEIFRKEYSEYNYFTNNKLIALSNVNALMIDNSLMINNMDLSYFNKLNTLRLYNLNNLNTLSFNNLNKDNNYGLLNNIDIDGCINLETININCIKDDPNNIYYPNFAENTILNVSKCDGLKYIHSNYPIKGLTKIILPSYLDEEENIISNFKELIFSNQYGVDYNSDITTICSRFSDVDNNIDLINIKLNKINLQTINLPTSINNLYLYVSNIDDININKYRQNDNLINIEGTYDFSLYEGDTMHSTFKGVDLSNIELLSSSNNTIHDFTSCFDGAIISDKTNIQEFLSNYSNITICSKMFKNIKGLVNAPEINTLISDTNEMFYNANIISIPNYNLSNVINADYMFYNCKDLVLNDDYVIDLNNCISNDYMFYNCKGIINPSFENNNSIQSSRYTFANCTALNNINLYDTSNMIDSSYMFNNCTSLSSIPNINTDNMRYMNSTFYNCKVMTGEADPNKYWSNSNIEEYALCFANCINLDNFYTEPPEGVPDEWGGAYENLGENDMEIKIIDNESTYPLINYLPTLYRQHRYNMLNNNYSAWEKVSNTDIRLLYPIKVTPGQSLQINRTSGIYQLSVISVDENNNNLNTIFTITTDTSKTFIIPNDCNYINILYRTQDCAAPENTNMSLYDTSIVDDEIHYDDLRISIIKKDGTISTDANNTPLRDVRSFYMKFDPSTTYIDFSNNIYIESISSIDLSKCPVCDNMFYSCENLKSIESINTKNVKSMVNMFLGCRSLISINNIDTSSCVNMSNAFKNCKQLTYISEMDLSNLLYMDNTFYECSNLLRIQYNTLENVKGMYRTFYNCKKLIQITNNENSVNESRLNTHNCINFENTFFGCTSLHSIEYIDTSNAISLYQTFYNCSSLRGSISLDTPKVTEVYGLFNGCSNIQTISNLNISKAKNISYVFYKCSKLKTIPVITCTNANNMTNAFYGCSSLERINFTYTNKIVSLNNAFRNCYMLREIIGLDTSSVQSFDYAFYGCSSLFSLSLNARKTTTMTYAFYGCTGINTIEFEADPNTNSTTDNVLNFDYAFFNCSSLINLSPLTFKNSIINEKIKLKYTFYGCSKLSNFNLNTWNLINIDSLIYTFAYCSSISTNDILTIEGWNMSDIKSINGMLSNTKIVNLDISEWNCNFINISYLFNNCTELEEVIGSNNLISSSTTNIGFLFNGCSKLLSIDTSNWNTSNVTDMQSFLRECTALTSIDLSGLDVRNVTSLNSAFKDSGLESIDLSTWELNSIQNLNNAFENCSSLTSVSINTNYPTITTMHKMFYNCTSLVNVPNDIYINDGISNGYVGIASEVFSNCTNLVSLGNIYIKGKVCNDLFYNCTNLVTIDKIEANENSKLENISNAFQECNKLTTINNLILTPANSESFNASNMFRNCISLTNINNSAVTNINSTQFMFYRCESIESINLNNWNTLKCIDMNNMFNQCINLSEIITGDSWDTSLVTDMKYMFHQCRKVTNIPLLNMMSCEYMQCICNECESLLTVNIVNSNNVESMNNAFYNCINLTVIPNLNTDSCINVTGMYNNCSKMTGTADPDKYWRKTPSILAYTNCFYKCTSLSNYETEIPIAWKGGTGVNTFSINSNNINELNKENIKREIAELLFRIETLNEKINNID